MDAPVITALAPTNCLARGGVFVRVTGQRFQTPYPPSNTIPALPPVDSVQVKFGGVLSKRVLVMSDTELFALAPQHAAGLVSIELANIGPDGLPVPGEYVTFPSVFTFRRPDLTVPTILQRVVRALLSLLMEQVLQNTVMTTDTDFDDSTGDMLNIIADAKLPVLVLVGPELKENRQQSTNEPRYITGPDGFSYELPNPTTVDLQFTLAGASDTTMELLNIQSEVVAFFASNVWLYLDVDPSDASKGQTRYELTATFDGAPDVLLPSNLSNLRQFNGVVLIRGVDVEWSDEAVINRTARVSTYTPAGSINEPQANVRISLESSPAVITPGETI